MDKTDYIKVTTTDGNTAVIHASNKDFYLRIGAKIEQPSDDEIGDIFPEYKPKTEPKPNDNETEKLREACRFAAKELEKTKSEKSALEQQILELQQEIADLKATKTTKKPKTTKQ